MYTMYCNVVVLLNYNKININNRKQRYNNTKRTGCEQTVPSTFLLCVEGQDGRVLDKHVATT